MVFRADRSPLKAVRGDSGNVQCHYRLSGSRLGLSSDMTEPVVEPVSRSGDLPQYDGALPRGIGNLGSMDFNITGECGAHHHRRSVGDADAPIAGRSGPATGIAHHYIQGCGVSRG